MVRSPGDRRGLRQLTKEYTATGYIYCRGGQQLMSCPPETIPLPTRLRLLRTGQKVVRGKKRIVRERA